MGATRNFDTSTPTPGTDPGALALLQVDLHGQELGKFGSEVASAGTHNGNYSAIQPISGGVSLTSATGTNLSWGVVTLSEGNTVYGDFTQIVISSGSAILYTAK